MQGVSCSRVWREIAWCPTRKWQLRFAGLNQAGNRRAAVAAHNVVARFN